MIYPKKYYVVTDLSADYGLTKGVALSIMNAAGKTFFRHGVHLRQRLGLDTPTRMRCEEAILKYFWRHIGAE